MQKKGYDWDAKTQTWYIYNLKEEENEILNKTDEQFLQELKAK